MDLNGFGLISSLASVLNGTRRGPAYSIARYVASRLDGTGRLTAKSVIDGAYVSRSAVRRFCNEMGYRSWSELRPRLSPDAFPSDLTHRDLTKPLSHYRSELDATMQAALADVRASASDELVRRLASLIHEHESVCLVGPVSASGALRRFQEELLFAAKHVEVVCGAYTLHQTEMPQAEPSASGPVAAEPLTIIVSVTGLFSQGATAWLAELPGKKALVTANTTVSGQERYDSVFKISSTARTTDELGAFGKYGLPYFFDLLSASYLHEYAQGPTKE